MKTSSSMYVVPSIVMQVRCPLTAALCTPVVVLFSKSSTMEKQEFGNKRQRTTTGVNHLHATAKTALKSSGSITGIGVLYPGCAVGTHAFQPHAKHGAFCSQPRQEMSTVSYQGTHLTVL